MRKPFNGDYKITQSFGNNPDYYKQFGFAGHEGVDFGTPNGTQILACAKGTVVRRNDVKDGAYGIYVVLWHKELNLATWYCHLQEIKVTNGQDVNEGDLIALSDNTGNTSGPHLHLNLCKTDANGYRINQDNGYKGFIDPMPSLQDTPQTGNTIIQQSDNWIALITTCNLTNNKDSAIAEVKRRTELADKVEEKDREIELKNTQLAQIENKLDELELENAKYLGDIEALGQRLKENNTKFSALQDEINELKKIKPITDYSARELLTKLLEKLF